MPINAGNKILDENRNAIAVAIASGQSVSDYLSLGDYAIVGVILPAAWTTAALTIEVSHDATTWIDTVMDADGAQCNVVASPAASTAYTLNLAGLLPYRYCRLRSGTTAAPVNQGAARSITVITRPLA
jgi:hypothetical protein